jgi:ferric-dicitrate binding protein FerR (iron transport regulator)
MADTNTRKDAAPKAPAPVDPSARQRSRSIAIAVGLVGLVVLFYLITIFKMGGNALNKGL